LKDPNHNTPVPHLGHLCAPEEKEALIGYIINDKMSVAAASRKVKMNLRTGYGCYRKYFNVQNPNIPAPIHIVARKRCTLEQIKEALVYVINDKMPIRAASRKADICYETTEKHYLRYLKDNNLNPPTKRIFKYYTQDQRNELIRCILEDKMEIKAASRKVKMGNPAAHQFFQRYLKRNNLEISHAKYTQDQIDELIGYIVRDKMSITAASKKKK
jgi:hypothetical protein